MTLVVKCFSNSYDVQPLTTVPSNTRSIFAWFMTIQEKQSLARAIEIPKEN